MVGIPVIGIVGHIAIGIVIPGIGIVGGIFPLGCKSYDIACCIISPIAGIDLPRVMGLNHGEHPALVIVGICLAARFPLVAAQIQADTAT